MIDYTEYFRKDGTQDRELIELIGKAYKQGYADGSLSVTEEIKNKIIEECIEKLKEMKK